MSFSTPRISKLIELIYIIYIYSSEHALDFLLHETLLLYLLQGEYVLSLDHVWSASVKMFFARNNFNQRRGKLRPAKLLKQRTF